ncbi:hypothetical protein AB0K18_35975 [Nonomuraea sp. NPDC049421]|uniref:hypothetical protein n=1 Tax=unclassified Nonomuraea TaxID=2593643 RepID=UPI003426D8B5
MSWWLRALWTAAVGLVTALLALTFVRLLEMPIELIFDTELRVRLNRDVHPRLTPVIGAMEALGIVVAAALATAERGTNRFRLTVLAGVLMVAAFVLWLAVVRPVNGMFATWMAQSVPVDWQHWHSRWTRGHIASAVLLSGALVLLLTALTGPRRVAGLGKRTRSRPDGAL